MVSTSLPAFLLAALEISLGSVFAWQLAMDRAVEGSKELGTQVYMQNCYFNTEILNFFHSWEESLGDQSLWLGEYEHPP